jgi:hypothetical protein
MILTTGEAAGHGRPAVSGMNKPLCAQAPFREESVSPAEPNRGKRASTQCISTASTRPVNSDLLDRIQIWVNEGGAGDDAR